MPYGGEVCALLFNEHFPATRLALS